MIQEELKRGLLTENAFFGLALGLCPFLAITNTLYNAVAFGISLSVVLVLANFCVALLKPLLRHRYHMLLLVVVVAVVVMAVDYVLFSSFVAVRRNLGIFIPLMAVNCIVLSRAELSSSSRGIKISLVDGIVMGIGSIVSLSVVGALRELLSHNSLWDHIVFPDFKPMLIFAGAPGAFILIGLLMALFGQWSRAKKTKGVQ